MREITLFDCFRNPSVSNTLYTTLQIRDFDREWADILNRFDTVIISLDSYRRKLTNYDEELMIANLAKLEIDKTVSYTPTLEEFYIKAHDTGASRFHMGFLYGKDLLPASLYIDYLERLAKMQAIYGIPEIGFFPSGKGATMNALTGWTAYSCFTSGVFISPDLTMTSCVPLYYEGYPGLVDITGAQFINEDRHFHSHNAPLIRKFFFQDIRSECAGCDYYGLCKGGCPYFSRIQGRDIYCQVYKMIFSHLLTIQAKETVNRHE
jgi:radical SAM protein with 4Fe4S-binding SPASM domain